MPESAADRLRLLATEALLKAGEMTDDACRRVMIDIAATYARLADDAEQRPTAKPPLDKPE
jgi:hypothetical protein